MDTFAPPGLIRVLDRLFFDDSATSFPAAPSARQSPPTAAQSRRRVPRAVAEARQSLHRGGRSHIDLITRERALSISFA